MQFFAAAEGVGAPALEEEGDYWRCLCPLGDGRRVALGSAQASYCVLGTRPSQGYPVLKAWRVPGEGRRLEALQHCPATGQFWALEQGQQRLEPASPTDDDEDDAVAAAEEGVDKEERHARRVLELVRYAGTEGADEEGRASAVLSAASATIGSVDDIGPDGTVAVSLEGGSVELWTYSSASGSLQRLQTLELGVILGVGTEGLLFTHVALLSPSLLAVGLSTDVWLIGLGDTAAGRAEWTQVAAGLLGELEQDGPGVLDCAVASGGGGQQRECLKAEDATTSAAALVLSHLSFHRPRYNVSEVKLLASGPGWVEVLVVAGRAAHVYRVAPLGDGSRSRGRRRPRDECAAPVVTPVAELGFSSLVLGTAMGQHSPEHPWLFVLTLSGVEVWALPPAPAPAHSTPVTAAEPSPLLSPCRLLVQRLEYRQRLDRLPPLALTVAGDALLLLANPPAHTPASLPEMLFHTVPRPSPEQRIPELSGQCPLGEGQGVDGAFGLGYDLLALRMQPLAAVYRHVHSEARRTLSFGGAPLRDGGDWRRKGDGGGGDDEEGQEEEPEEEEDGQYLARFVEREMLDASVYGIQPERVIHHSGAALLTTMHALLAHAAAAAASAVVSESVLEAVRAEEARALYTALARKCASLLGSVWLEARAEGIEPELARACAWFLRSDTPLLDVCGRLLARWREDEQVSGAGGVLVDFLRRGLGSQQPGHEEEKESMLPPLVGWEDDEGDVEEDSNGGERASWGAVLRFAHAVGGTPLLGWLLMKSSLPWDRLPRTRATARRLLLGGDESNVASTPPDVRALLLTLALHDLAAVVASPTAKVTLDSTGGVAWLSLPGVEVQLASATALAEPLSDDAVAEACLRAAPAVVKHLVLQDVPLVVKGPFFPHLEAQRPYVLARVLAAAVARPELSGSEFLFETPQVLRLLGPWGLGLAQEMGRFLAKNEKLLASSNDATATSAAPASASAASRAAASSPVPTALAAFRSPSMGDELEGFTKDSSPSKELVRLFLAARFDDDDEQRDDAGGPIACPDAFPWRQLLVAELLGLDLDKMEGGSMEHDSSSSCLEVKGKGKEEVAAAWLVQLAAALPCGRDSAVVRRLVRLLSTPNPGNGMDWEWVLRWLLPRLNSNTTPNRSPAALAAARLIKTVCLAQAGGGRLVGEAVELLFSLLAETGFGTEAAVNVLMGFGRALFASVHGAEHWRLVLAKAAALPETADVEGREEAAAATTNNELSLYEALMQRLSQALPPRALVEAIPEDADVDQVLALLEGGSFLSVLGCGRGDGGLLQ